MDITELKDLRGWRKESETARSEWRGLLHGQQGSGALFSNGFAKLSYYLLHLMSPGIYLHKERGLLRYERGDERKQLPLEDIRGVIIVTEKVTLTDRLIVALLENGAFILHCDKKYRPIGLTEPLPKIIKREVACQQARCTKKLQAARFRKKLLDDGYSMLQFSVYMRSCGSWERMQKHARRLRVFAPVGGNIRAILMTEKQWVKSIAIVSESYRKKKKTDLPHQLSIFENW